MYQPRRVSGMVICTCSNGHEKDTEPIQRKQVEYFHEHYGCYGWLAGIIKAYDYPHKTVEYM